MFREARIRVEDAEMLTPHPLSARSSSSRYLLNLLAFELLLKLAYEISTVNKADQNHYYAKIFRKFSQSDQVELLNAACELADCRELRDETELVLSTLGENFIFLRYPYEKYKSLTEAEYVARGSAWAANGFQSEDATFRLFPEALYGLTKALEVFIERRCTFVNDPITGA